MQAAIAQKATIARSPAKRTLKAAPAITAPRAPWGPSWTHINRSEGARWAAEQLTKLLSEMEVPPIDDAARLRLQRLMYFHGPEHVTLLIRTIIESAGNEGALIQPVISAVSEVMSRHRDWTDKGLAWIEAFDSIPLLATVETMRGLDIFEERSLARYLAVGLSNKLRHLDPPPTQPKPKRAYKK